MDWRSLTGEFYCVDAGSRGGFHDLALLHPLVHMYSFDADTAVQSRPQGFASFHHESLALYSSETELDLHVTAHPGMTSLLEFDEAAFVRHFGLVPGSETWKRGLTATRKQKTRTIRADDYFSSRGLSRIDYFKLDTQGTELEILRGARDFLAEGRIHVLKVEVSFCPIYRNQCFFSEVDQFLKSFGFLFVDCMSYPDTVLSGSRQTAVRDVNLREQLRLNAVGDAIYVLDPNNYSQGDKSGTSIRSAVILNQMGYLSFAFDLLRGAGQSIETAERLLQETANRESLNQRSKRFLKHMLPPWAYRAAVRLRRLMVSAK